MERLSGSAVELGSGQGLNFPHYPDTVTELIAIEPEPLRVRAAEAAANAPVNVRVLGGFADLLLLREAR
jgi:hypothetical protein